MGRWSGITSSPSLLLAGLLACAWPASVAVATPRSPDPDTADRRAAARALFNQGVKLMDAEAWDAAADRFDRARALVPSPRVSFNLSTALERGGRLVYAAEVLRALLIDKETPPEVMEAAAERLREIEPRIGALTVVVQGDREGAELRLDGEAIAPALLGAPIPVDPRAHSVTVVRGGRVVLSRGVVIEPGARKTLPLALPVRAVVPAEVPGPKPEPARDVLIGRARDDADGTEPRDRSWLWWAGGAAVAVGLSVAVFLIAQPDAPTATPGDAEPIYLR